MCSIVEQLLYRRHWNAAATGIARLAQRATSKIAVDLDGDFARKLESHELKPRQHPGVVKGGRVELPPHIISGIERAVGDYPIKALIQEAKKLNQYISSRHPPPEQHEVQTRMQRVVAEADERMPLENLKGLSEEEAEQWRRRRQLYIQKRLNERTYAWKALSYGAYESIIYALGRGAMEYGVLLRVMQEIAKRDVDFQPRTYFDFGSGVGTGMWAASSIWKKTIFEYFNVDSSRDMNDLSEMLLRGGSENKEMSLREVYYRQFLPSLDTKYDLVVSAYSLFELPSASHRKEVLLNLWRKCSGYMVIVEEGTRRGSELVNEARQFLLRQQDTELKAHTFAPCAHDMKCPRLRSETDRTPCNFEAAYTPLKISDVRTDRLTTHYSYAVLKKGDVEDATREWPRLVRPTLVRSKHSICRMCTAQANLQEIIFTASKHGKEAYQCARASKWGDRLPIAIGEPFETLKRNKKSKYAESNAEQSFSETT